MLHAPYRGSAPAVIDVGGGRVDIMFDGAASLLAMIQAGKVRPLATLSSARLPTLADVPTVEEVGNTGVEVRLWSGLRGRAGLAARALRRVRTALGRTVQLSD